MRNVFYLAVFLISAVFSPYVWAVKVNSIYKAEVFVATQSAQDKARAVKDGMAEVLTKVSGNLQILDNPALQASLSHADTFAQEYSYASPKTAPKDTPYLLTIRYDSQGINRLLREAGSPIWGQNRPLILLWLAYESPTHPLDIVDSSTGDNQSLIENSAKLRGIPIIFPVMDVTEMGQVTANDIANKTIPTIQQASKRYDSNAILLGQVTQTKSDLTSHWELISDADKWDWDVTGKNLQEVYANAINHVADTLAGRYAVVVSEGVSSQLTLKVSGIKQEADLMQVMRYLQHLTPVADVLLDSVNGDEVILNVSLHGNKQAFIQAVSIGKNLVPVTAKDHQDDVLLYQWTQ